MFVCQGNRFRSQVAEALFNAWAPPGWHAVSGGTKPGEAVHPKAISLMAEVGVDISRQKPKPFDLDIAAKAWRVATVCSLGACPVDIADKAEYWDIADPADVPESEWRGIREEIAGRVRGLLREIAAEAGPRTNR